MNADPLAHPTVKAVINALQTGVPRAGQDPSDTQGFRVRSEVTAPDGARRFVVVKLTADDGFAATVRLDGTGRRLRLADAEPTGVAPLELSLPDASWGPRRGGLAEIKRLIVAARSGAAPATAAGSRPTRPTEPELLIAGRMPMTHRMIRWMRAELERPTPGSSTPHTVHSRAYAILAVPDVPRPHHIVVEMTADDLYAVTARLDATGPRLRIATDTLVCPAPLTLRMRGGATREGRPAELAARLAEARRIDAELKGVDEQIAAAGRDSLLVYTWAWPDGTGGELRLGDQFAYDWTAFGGKELSGRIARIREQARDGRNLLHLDLVLQRGSHRTVTVTGGRNDR